MTSSLSNLPLLNQSAVESTHSTLTSITKASAALKNGKLPTSDQLVNAIRKLLATDLIQPEIVANKTARVSGSGKLSKRGKDLVLASREVLESVIRLVLEKNDDDKIQRFIFATTQASVDVNVNLETPSLPTPSSAEISAAKDSLQDLLTLLLTSNNLRSLLTDSINVFRDLFADAAEQLAEGSITVTRKSKKAANKLRPDEEERRGNGYNSEDFEKVPSGKELKKRAGRAAEDIKDDALDRVQQKTREVKKYIDEKLPTDVKDAAIERFKAIIDEIQADPQYERAINTLISLVRKYAVLSKEAVKEAASSSTANVQANGKVEDASTLFREIIESFTGPLDSVIQTLNKVIQDVDNDPRIKSLFDSISAFLDRSLSEPQYITSSKAQRRAESLYDQSQALVASNASWKKDSDALIKELNLAFEKASNDKALVELGRRLENFGDKASRFSKEGMSLVDGSGVWSDISSVFLPRLLNALKEIPLPRVEYVSKDVDLIIDNVRFTSASFIPDLTHFTSTIDLVNKKGPVAFHSHFNNTTTLSIGGLRLQARDISYYINKKTGWIGLNDAGLLDIFVGSEREDAEDGLDITITLEKADADDVESYFVVKDVKVEVTGFQIRVHHSQHFFRNFFARPALRSYLEASFVSALEQQITEMFKSADASLYAFLLRSQGAATASPDPATFLQAIFKSTFSSSGSTFSTNATSTGITKVGTQGEYILNIGVQESLLGQVTGLGLLGRDITAKKRTVENLMEEGRATVDEAIENGRAAVDELGEGSDDLEDEFRERDRRERAQGGWKSSAFDL